MISQPMMDSHIKSANHFMCTSGLSVAPEWRTVLPGGGRAHPSAFFPQLLPECLGLSSLSQWTHSFCGILPLKCASIQIQDGSLSRELHAVSTGPVCTEDSDPSASCWPLNCPAKTRPLSWTVRDGVGGLRHDCARKTTPAGGFPTFPSNLIGHALSQAFLKWSSILSNVLLSPWVFTHAAHSRWTPWHVRVLYPFSHMQIVCLWTKTLWCFLSHSLRTPYSLPYRDPSLKQGALSPATPCLNQRRFPFSFPSWGWGHMKPQPNKSVLWRIETSVPMPRLEMPLLQKTSLIYEGGRGCPAEPVSPHLHHILINRY